MSTNIELQTKLLPGSRLCGRVEADIESLNEMGFNVESGDILEIEGERRTPVIISEPNTGELEDNKLCIDKLTSTNAGIEIGEEVTARKAEVEEAEEVVLQPANPDVEVWLSDNVLHNKLHMRPITEGDIITPTSVTSQDSTSQDEGFFDSFFESDSSLNQYSDFFGTKTRLEVVETEPTGIVRVGEDTNIKLRYYNEDKEGKTELPERAIIRVKEHPETDEMREVEDFHQIRKLSREYKINRYEDEDKVMFFIKPWYYMKEK